jgi:multidrug efflux system outer membrane protein
MVQLAVSVLRLARAGVVAVALAGCALSTPPAHEDVLRDALPKTTGVPGAWKAEAAQGPVADDWLRALRDPVLEALVLEAVANNRDLAQAAQRVKIAQQAVVVAGAQLLPQVGATVGARTTYDEHHDGTFDATAVYANVAWELDLWGRLRAQRAAVEAAATATALDYAYARQSIAATVAKAWYLASEARQQLALAEQAVTVYDELLALVTIRRTSGKDSALDVAATSARLNAAKGHLEAARAAYGETRRALEVLLGRYPAADIEAAAGFSPLPPPASPGLPAALLERRPDLAAAEQQVLAAFRQQESAKLALLPGVSFSLVGGRLGDPLLSALQLNPWLASAAVGMTIPIYEGGALRAKVEIATAREAQAVAAYGAAALVAFREVENALANERYLARRLPFYEAALANSTDAVRIAGIQYRAGRRDLLWVSNLQTDQLATEALVIRVRGLQRANRIQLHLALGGSFDACAAASTTGCGAPGHSPASASQR